MPPHAGHTCTDKQVCREYAPHTIHCFLTRKLTFYKSFTGLSITLRYPESQELNKCRPKNVWEELKVLHDCNVW